MSVYWSELGGVSGVEIESINENSVTSTALVGTNQNLGDNVQRFPQLEAGKMVRGFWAISKDNLFM